MCSCFQRGSTLFISPHPISTIFLGLGFLEWQNKYLDRPGRSSALPTLVRLLLRCNLCLSQRRDWRLSWIFPSPLVSSWQNYRVPYTCKGLALSQLVLYIFLGGCFLKSLAKTPKALKSLMQNTPTYGVVLMFLCRAASAAGRPFSRQPISPRFVRLGSLDRRFLLSKFFSP